MLITAIEPRRKGLSALFIDGEFAMDLDTNALLEMRFDVGREIDDEELRQMIEYSGERRAKEKALWLISYRDHSKKELKEKIRRTCDETSAEKAVDRMEELGLVDDEDYARRYARKLLLQKKMTKRAVAFELSRKGIDRETAEAALDAIDVDYRENIRELLERKYKNLDDEKTKRRAAAALQRLGYGWEDIRSVFDEYDTNES